MDRSSSICTSDNPIAFCWRCRRAIRAVRYTPTNPTGGLYSTKAFRLSQIDATAEGTDSLRRAGRRGKISRLYQWWIWSSSAPLLDVDDPLSRSANRALLLPPVPVPPLLLLVEEVGPLGPAPEGAASTCVVVLDVVVVVDLRRWLLRLLRWNSSPPRRRFHASTKAGGIDTRSAATITNNSGNGSSGMPTPTVREREGRRRTAIVELTTGYASSASYEVSGGPHDMRWHWPAGILARLTSTKVLEGWWRRTDVVSFFAR